MRGNGNRTRKARLAAPVVAAHLVSLAAAPTFATMALLTAASDRAHEVTGSTAHDASPLGGMVLMYVLMGVFHTAPWLKRFSRGRRKRALESHGVPIHPTKVRLIRRLR